MKLLIITQAVDTNDTTLGFFHSWIERFARECESVIVICLKEGRHQLPPNVKVLSLGKERSEGRLGYVLNFYKYIFSEHGGYDAVFIHMNQEYALLGGLWWRLCNIPTALWYNHTYGSIISDIAAIFVRKVFYTSPFAYMAKKGKAIAMPAGIDTDFFKPHTDSSAAVPRGVLFLGRISPVKKVELFVDTLLELERKEITFEATICGDPISGDEAYAGKIKTRAAPLIEAGMLKIISGVPHTETKKIYAHHEFYVNLTQTGSLDKTVLEAMACELLVLASNKSFQNIISNDSVLKEEATPADIAQAFVSVMNLSADEKIKRGEENRLYVLENHSISALVTQVIQALS